MSKKNAQAQLDLIEDGGRGLMFQYPDIFCDHIIGVLVKSLVNDVSSFVSC
jgi:hypothetical protein